MKKLFSSPGKLYHLEDAEGNSIPKAFAEIAHPVLVDVKYELKPSPPPAGCRRYLRVQTDGLWTNQGAGSIGQ